jgi:hypothetical protein
VLLLPVLAIALVLAVLAGLYIHSTCATDGRESFGDKHEWSILQSLEAMNRDKPISDLEFSERAGYHILYAPAANQKRVWIMLDPKSPPFYKQLPHGKYSLSGTGCSHYFYATCYFDR